MIDSYIFVTGGRPAMRQDRFLKSLVGGHWHILLRNAHERRVELIRSLAAGFGCIASIEFIRRFTNTCCKLTGSASTIGRFEASRISTEVARPSKSEWSSRRTSRMISFKFTGRRVPSLLRTKL